MTATIQTTTELEKAADAPIERFKRGEPGIYEGIAAEEYHRLRAVSSTVLKRIHTESAKHARAILNNPDLIGSDEIDIGGATHSLLLTPDEFDSAYICAGQCEATVKSSGLRCENSGVLQDQDQRWLCGVHGKGLHRFTEVTVLSVDSYRRAKGIHDAVWNNDRARGLLQAATEREVTVLWKEGDYDSTILCKARFDLLCRTQGILPDIKTCRTANPHQFMNQAWKLGYHLQLAHYLRGAAVAGIAADVPVIIAVENDDPFDVVVFEPTRKLMDRGIAARDSAIRVLLDCERSGDWPGYASGVELLDVPEWAN